MGLLIRAYRRDCDTSRHGQFWCPRCGVVTTYNEVLGRLYLHVLFVPLLPLDSGILSGIRCTSCYDRFDEDAINYRPDLEITKWKCPQCSREYRDNMIRCPICKVRPDGTPA